MMAVAGAVVAIGIGVGADLNGSSLSVSGKGRRAAGEGHDGQGDAQLFSQKEFHRYASLQYVSYVKESISVLQYIYSILPAYEKVMKKLLRKCEDRKEAFHVKHGPALMGLAVMFCAAHFADGILPVDHDDSRHVGPGFVLGHKGVGHDDDHVAGLDAAGRRAV